MRFHSKAIEEHSEVPLADDGRLEELVAQWTERAASRDKASADGNACFVLSIQRENDQVAAQARRAEIEALVRAQGDQVVGAESYVLLRPDPRTLIRSGVAERIAASAQAAGADMLVVDAELTPSQTRNLQSATGFPICDREAVILNVFQRHAATRRAHVQIEIARLEYLRPRIRGIGLNMSQQMGGIRGGKGPGETASELMARRLDARLLELRRTLNEISRADRTQRKHRSGCERVALVGYTNAGKTSLMNALTSAGLSARDRPFETLDATSRCLTRNGRPVLLSDSVGFIRDLPERLFASFASTLAEVAEASLLALVLDAADPELELHLRTTEEVLSKLDAQRIPRLVVFNKVDRLGVPFHETGLSSLAGERPYVALSSHDPKGVGELRDLLLGMARGSLRKKEIFVPYMRQELTQAIYSRCRVLETHASAHGTQFLIEGEAHTVEQIARALRRRDV